jgi:predicted permease
MGVRVALGASGARLARQLLTESVLLSALGAAVGFGLACWGSVALKNFIMRGYLVPSALNVSPDLRVLGFTAALAILTGILFGLAPVWQLARRSAAGALQENSRTLGNPAGRFGKGLICTQVALSLVLLMGAGLFIRSLEKLSSVDPGFQTQSVLDIELFPRPHGYENLDNLSYYSELLGRVSRLPGVAGAALSHFRPAGGYEWQEPVSASSSAMVPGIQAGQAWVSPGFFETLGIRLLSGRDFNWQDNERSPRVAILSQSLAGRLFPAGDAIGRRINIGAEPKWQNVEVIGIVADTHLYDVRTGNTATAYVDVLQMGEFAHWSSLEVRAAGNPMAVVAAARNTVDALGHEYVLMMRTLEQVKDRALLNERLTAMLSELFGGLALLLVATGLYGLMGYNVAQRTRELGVRIALGAPQASILWMVLRETLTLIIIGLAIGIPCALMAAKLIAHMLFGLSPHDPLTLGAVLLALILATVLAGYIPARRATKVDPMVALRYE